MENNNEGFTMKTYPLVKIRICNGCKYLNKQAAMRGHKTVTNNFTCTHPQFQGETVLFGNQPGRTIHFNHEGDCETPSFCPFLTEDS